MSCGSCSSAAVRLFSNERKKRGIPGTERWRARGDADGCTSDSEGGHNSCFVGFTNAPNASPAPVVPHQSTIYVDNGTQLYSTLLRAGAQQVEAEYSYEYACIPISRSRSRRSALVRRHCCSCPHCVVSWRTPRTARRTWPERCAPPPRRPPTHSEHKLDGDECRLQSRLCKSGDPEEKERCVWGAVPAA